MRRIRPRTTTGHTPLRFVATVAILLIVGVFPVPGQPRESTYQLSHLFTHVADVKLGGATSRFDYQSYDPITSRLYIADMGSGRLLVFDTRARRLIASLSGFPKITGILAVPALHRIYASVPGAGIGASLSVALGMAGLSPGAGQGNRMKNWRSPCPSKETGF